ncbi:hypothetical protein F2P79_006723 [Pimephales promelas]|nr:hypothetical protein F2P79_006723 [Pimephales promelas]
MEYPGPLGNTKPNRIELLLSLHNSLTERKQLFAVHRIEEPQAAVSGRGSWEESCSSCQPSLTALTTTSTRTPTAWPTSKPALALSLLAAGHISSRLSL